MGYETKYTVTASEHIPNFDDVLQEYSGGYYFEDGYADCKWYHHIEHMKLLASKYPRIIFTVMGIGENHDNMWVKYFLDGKVQEVNAKITFEPFDESMLK